MNCARIIVLLGLAVLTATAETRVRIEGVRQLSANQLLDLLGDRLAYVRASPATPPLADDAAFLLRQLLRKDGYQQVRVEWRIPRPDEIVLEVTEGQRRSLQNVTVMGVSAEDAKRDARIYGKPARKFHPLGSGPPPFRDEDIEQGLTNLRHDYQARGYWLVTADLRELRENSATGTVDVIIALNPGPRHSIGTPVITSDIPGESARAATAANPHVGQIATTANLNHMRLAVEESVTSIGYPDAEIRMTRLLDRERFIPQFQLTLGRRVQLRQISLAGLERSSPRRLLRRLTPLTGQWYDEAAMNKHLREFLATGAFSSVQVETTPVSEHIVDATLHFDETRAREVSVAAGFGSYQGALTRLTYADRNLFGSMLGFNAGMEIGSRGLLGEVRLTDPWLYGSDVSLTARAYALMFNREGYETSETGIEGKLRWKYGSHYMVDLLAGVAQVSLTEDELPAEALGLTGYTHSRLLLTQSLDYRDNPVLPHRGWHLEMPMELGAAVGSTSTSYTKVGLTGGWFHPLGRHYQLGLGGECAWLAAAGNSGDLPIDLRLFNGGARSVRSFPERELGPSIDNNPTGGTASWNANLELSRDIAGSLRGVVFFDAGSLTNDDHQRGSGDLELAVGLGLRLDLPVGPVRLEYGYNLTRDPGEPTGTIHFAIGFAY